MKRFAVLLALLLVGCSAAGPQPSGQSAGSGADPAWGQHVAAAAFEQQLKTPGAVLIDVRTPAEFAAGHLEGAKNIDINAADFTSQIKALPKDGTYLIYCRSANRSRTAIKIFEKEGFQKTLGLEGGISVWKGPIVK